MDSGPLLRAVLVRPDKGPAAVLLTFDHTASDGISMSAVLRELLTALSGRSDADSDETRSSTLENVVPSIAGVPRPVRRPWFWLRFLRRRLGDLWWRLRHGVVRSIPHMKAAVAQQRTRIIRRSIEPEDVAALRRRAASEGVFPHAILCAAQILAIRGLFDREGAVSLAVYSPTDLRPRLDWRDGIGVPQDHMGQYVGYARSLHAVRPGMGPWDLAREVRDQLRRRVAMLDDLGYNVINHGLMRILARWFRPDIKGAARLARSVAASAVALAEEAESQLRAALTSC